MTQPQLMTNNKAATNQYKRQGILSASPIELIVMLYDGLRKDILLSKRAIEKKDVANANKYLLHAQAIVSELMNSLDMEVEMSKELMRLYDFMIYALGETNLKKDTELLDPLSEMVGELREAWNDIAEQSKTGGAAASVAAGVNLVVGE